MQLLPSMKGGLDNLRTRELAIRRWFSHQGFTSRFIGRFVYRMVVRKLRKVTFRSGYIPPIPGAAVTIDEGGLDSLRTRELAIRRWY